jgi:hypothetical protein
MTSSFYFGSRSPDNILDPDGDKSDITISADGTVLTIDPGVVTFAKMQDIPSGTILGRSTAGSGVVELITIGNGLEIVDGVLRAIDVPEAPANPAPENIVAPGAFGSVIEGSVVSVTSGSWLYSPTSYTYQWRRNGVDIFSQTDNNYTLTSADVGSLITCLVNATNSGGTTGRVSNSIGPVVSGVPVIRTQPVVSGPTSVGGQLSTTTGAWSNSPTSYTYSWRRDGSVIFGANSSTYNLVVGDIGTTISSSIVAINAVGSSVASISSNSLGPIVAADAAGPFDLELIGGGSLQLIGGENIEILAQSLEYIGGGTFELIGGGTIDLIGLPTGLIPTNALLLNGEPVLLDSQFILV